VKFADPPVQGSATRDRRTGEIILKLVNPEFAPQTLPIEIEGVTSLEPTAEMITLAGRRDETNSISHSRNVVPVTSMLDGVKPVSPARCRGTAWS
jgi:alpha-L-arabinofuranosidase